MAADKAGYDAAFEAAYAKGRFRRGVTLVAATSAAALIGLVIFLALPPPKYVARWDQNPVRISDDGRRVVLVITGQDCDDSVFYQVQQSDELVRITAVVTQHHLRPCRSPVLRRFSLLLDRPLGERPLIDGRCTHEEAEAAATEDCPALPVVPVQRG